MPVKRRVAKARDHRITPEAVAAYQAHDSLALHRALGLKPWEASPLDENNPYSPGTGYGRSWQQSRDLRSQLEN